MYNVIYWKLFNDRFYVEKYVDKAAAMTVGNEKKEHGYGVIIVEAVGIEYGAIIYEAKKNFVYKYLKYLHLFVIALIIMIIGVLLIYGKQIFLAL